MFFSCRAPIVLWSLMIGSAAAQSGNTVAGGGYSLPVPFAVAPGQVINLFVTGVGSSLTGRVAAGSTPLPLSLAGISASLVERDGLHPMPVFAVTPVSTCFDSNVTNCGTLTMITAQIPSDLAFPAERETVPNPVSIQVAENGTPGTVTQAIPQLDSVHILTTCDANTTTTAPCSGSQPIVTHANGNMVTAAAPAKIGEEVVMYAFGLGVTTPVVAAGAASPASAPKTTSSFILSSVYGPNLPPAVPVETGPVCTSCPYYGAPLFAGLTPGFVGLYQVNFIVPPTGSTIAIPCAELNLKSNLTVTLIGHNSSDGAGICVDVPNVVFAQGTSASAVKSH